MSHLVFTHLLHIQQSGGICVREHLCVSDGVGVAVAALLLLMACVPNVSPGNNSKCMQPHTQASALVGQANAIVHLE